MRSGSNVHRAAASWFGRSFPATPTAPSFEMLMLAEKAHRVANDMTIINCLLHRATRAEPSGMKHAISEAIEHVNVVGDIQRLLIPPIGEQTRELKSELELVCRRVARARLDAKNVLFAYAVDTCEMSAHTCWAICAIVTELVTNAAKHAFPENGGTVAVTGRCCGRMLVMSVADNGVGLAGRSCPGVSPKGSGIGTRIVEQLVAALGGELHRPDTPTGTAVEFWISLDGR